MRLLRSRLVSTISFSGLARMDNSLLGNNVLKDHRCPTRGGFTEPALSGAEGWAAMPMGSGDFADVKPRFSGLIDRNWAGFGVGVMADAAPQPLLLQISCETCAYGCDMLIYFRALALRFSWCEVENHARRHIAVLKAVEYLVDRR